MNNYLVVLGNTAVARFNNRLLANQFLHSIPASDRAVFNYSVIAI